MESADMDNKKESGKAVAYILGVIASLCFIVSMVVVSVEVNIHNESFFINEYEKTGVDKDLGMTMDDIKVVSTEMMKYLFGEREDLVIYTTLRGQYREFFNDREKTHMVDVKAMLDNAILVRRICMAIMVLCLAGLIAGYRRRTVHFLCRSYCYTVAGVVAFFGAIGIFILVCGFTEFWMKFHGIFFTNDLWLLDPATDMMILLLPEQFFSDLVASCVILFAVVVIIVLILSIGARIMEKKGRKELPKTP